MAEDYNFFEGQQEGGIGVIPALASASHDCIPGEPASSPEEDARLRTEASRVARSWKIAASRRSPRLLRQKWEGVSKSIREILVHLQRIPPSGLADDPASEWLKDNSRLLKAGLLDTRESLKTAGGLPEIETGGHQTIKRAYAAAAAYLRATHYIFQANTFVTYFAATQEVQAFEISEIWALKPMMQLVLLEKVVNASRPLLSDEDRDTDHNKSADDEFAVEISRVITSLRETGNAEWKEIFEKLSVVEQILRGDPSGTYPMMDFESRDLYRRAVRELGATSEANEVEVAQRAIGLARVARGEWSSDPRVRERRRHVGYYLVDRGREVLEKQIRYQPPFSKQLEKTVLAWPEVWYLVGIELLTFAAMAFVLGGVFTSTPLMLALLLLFLPAMEAAVGMMNQWVAFILPPRVLPKLDFSAEIPSDSTTIVVVPTLLLDEEYVVRMTRELEIRFLANRDANLHFALLTDSPDSSQPSDERDELIGLCSNLIEQLNKKYGGQARGSFFLFHRTRVFNPSEGAWMGWERKRGKLLDLNNALRGDRGNFSVVVGDLSLLPKVRYVITLDSDTQLPRGAAHRLVGTLAHPLNRAVVDPRTNTVAEGYGILQPRVGVSVQAASRSLLANIYSGETGFDVYTRATSDVYQDLFGEGSFTGKGIYEVDVFQQVLAQRFPSNAILSHDLIEGNYARAGLVSDIELVDDYPSHFSAYSRRKHRWVRGDWQIIWWLLPRVPDFHGQKVRNPLSLISRWKILDNLRRSIIEIAMLALLLAGWILLPGSPLRWTVATLVLILIPIYVQFILSLLRLGRVQDVVGYLKEITGTFVSGQVNVFLLLAFLPYQTLVMLDAIIRTVVRLTITRKKLLEWETAAQTELRTQKTPVDVYLRWTLWFSLAIGAVLAVFRPGALPAASPLLVLWACSNPLARWLNRSLRPGRVEISNEDQELLRRVSLRTWRFFRQFTKGATNGLVPDNVQETPPDVAHRISPTNLGLLLNSHLAAFELGYLTLPELVHELEKTLTTAKRLPRHKGHFLNWYDTRTLEPLDPLFVSTVDSGNLACCLWTLKQACLKLSKQSPIQAELWRGLSDHFNLMDEIATNLVVSKEVKRNIRRLTARVDMLGDNRSAWILALPVLEHEIFHIEQSLAADADLAKELLWWTSETIERVRNIRSMIEQLTPWLSFESGGLVRQVRTYSEGSLEDLPLDLLPTALADLDRKLHELPEKPWPDCLLAQLGSSVRQRLPKAMSQAECLVMKLNALAQDAESLVQEMDFRFLYNSRRKVLSVGYDARTQRLEEGCYDLLASEARSAAFVAIAKGDIPQESWFHMGRAHVQWKGERALLSWAGTMFEYLMPTLWLKNYPHTVLDQSARAAVRCQQKWAESRGLPWGISEAAYTQKNAAGHYQYQGFGVPMLALRRYSADDWVVSPYATFLALAVDPGSAVRNLRRMRDMNLLGIFGFYEAADFAPSRVSPPEHYRPVRCWMAHHQGMSLLAVCNLLADGVIQDLFHAEPAVAATELLLHEKVSRAIRVEPAAEDLDSAPIPREEGGLMELCAAGHRPGSQRPEAGSGTLDSEASDWLLESREPPLHIDSHAP